MTLTINQLGDNPQQPGIYAETYIPDQLIAGIHPLITRNATLSGSAALQRGTLLGRVTRANLSSSTGKAYASGTVLIAAVPTSGDTLTIAGTAITFVSANPYGNQVLIGSTAVATAQNLLAFLNGSTDTNIVKCTYSLSTATITATAAAIGTGGNSLTLATSNASAFTLSGATLSGGTANTGTATIGSITAGTALKIGTYSIVLTSATVGNVFDPNGDSLGTTTMGTAFTDNQINFTITTGGSPAAGDTFIINSAPASWVYKQAVASAVDGSQVPVAILADYADPSAGNVVTGVYIKGEFNQNAVIYDPGYSLDYLKYVLDPLSIILRSSISASDPS